jgi:hypothetical protein
MSVAPICTPGYWRIHCGFVVQESADVDVVGSKKS